MPYTLQLQNTERKELNPHIDQCVQVIVDKSKDLDNPLSYVQFQVFALYQLALLFHPSERKGTIIISNLALDKHNEIVFRESELMAYKEIFPHLLNLRKVIELKIETPHDGMEILNYCCTEILLLSTPDTLRFKTLNLINGICECVGHILKARLMKDDSCLNDILATQIIGVFREIQNEFYRRVIAPYEDLQIIQSTHGDTRGYLKWLPQPEK